MEGQRNLAGGGFGRRGLPPMQATAGPARADPPRAEPPRAEPPSSGAGWDGTARAERPSTFKYATYALLTLVGLIALEAILSDTTLITPINGVFLNVMRLVGFLLGLPLGAYVAFNSRRPIGIARKILIILVMPFIAGFAGGEAAWRIADRTEFAFSSDMFVPASYPIVRVHRGRRGSSDAFAIDPFNVRDDTEIAVPAQQFRAYAAYATDYCITVMQRRSASGAVEILNDGVFNLSPPAPAILTACPEAAARTQQLRMQEEMRRAGLRS